MISLQKVLPQLSGAVILISHLDLYCVPWSTCKAKFNIFFIPDIQSMGGFISFTFPLVIGSSFRERSGSVLDLRPRGRRF